MNNVSGLDLKFLVLFLILITSSGQLFSAEYSDRDLEPGISEIFFTRDAIGFISVPISYRNPKKRKQHYFVLLRNQEEGREIDQTKFRSLFSTKIDKSKPNLIGIETLSTSDGTAYGLIDYYMDMKCPWVSDISEYAKRNIVGPDGETFQSITMKSKTIQTYVHVCNKITALEHVNGRLWVGTGYSGDHNSHQGQGVIIQDRQTGQVIKEIKNIGAWTTQIRSDPYSEQVWIIASSTIKQMNQGGSLISQYRFFHEFDPSTGLPTFIMTSKDKLTNPLAVIARIMSKDNAKELYKVTQTMQKEDIYKLSLYNFYMCCGINRSFYYPDTMNKLAMVLLKELKLFNDSNNQRSSHYTERWIQTLCNFNSQKVLAYFKSIAIKENKFPARLVNSCIEKLEEKFSQNKAYNSL